MFYLLRSGKLLLPEGNTERLRKSFFLQVVRVLNQNSSWISNTIYINLLLNQHISEFKHIWQTSYTVFSDLDSFINPSGRHPFVLKTCLKLSCGDTATMAISTAGFSQTCTKLWSCNTDTQLLMSPETTGSDTCQSVKSKPAVSLLSPETNG